MRPRGVVLTWRLLRHATAERADGYPVVVDSHNVNAFDASPAHRHRWGRQPPTSGDHQRVDGACSARASPQTPYKRSPGVGSTAPDRQRPAGANLTPLRGRRSGALRARRWRISADGRPAASGYRWRQARTLSWAEPDTTRWWRPGPTSADGRAGMLKDHARRMLQADRGLRGDARASGVQGEHPCDITIPISGSTPTSMSTCWPRKIPGYTANVSLASRMARPGIRGWATRCCALPAQTR